MISQQQIKYITSLQQKKYRSKHLSYIIEGAKMVSEALQQVPTSIEYICFSSTNAEIASISRNYRNIIFLELSDKEFSKISSLKNPQGILAILKQPELKPQSEFHLSSMTLVLDSIRDPGNLGTIIRLCDWFGINQVVCSPDTVDCFNPKVVQATMGAILRINLMYTELIEWLSQVKGYSEVVTYGTTMDGENLYTTNLKKPAILIMGNESVGISDNILKLLDKKLCIPNQSIYPGKTESLNVAIATAIVCSEFIKVPI